MISKIIVLLLMVIAGIVSFFQIKQNPKKAWPWIVIYWLTLTVKNLIDFVGLLL